MSRADVRARGWLVAFGAAAAGSGALLKSWVGDGVAEVVALSLLALGGVVAFTSYFFERPRHRAQRVPELPRPDDE